MVEFLRTVLLTLISKTYFMINCNYEPHHYLPLHLERAQVKNPSGVFAEFFAAYKLPECRLYLWQMLKWYGREKEKETLIDHSALFSFYEEMICFVEAAYLLHQGDQPKVETGLPETSENKEGITEMEDPLVPIINIIKNSMDAEKIYLLGIYPMQPVELGGEYDLLILVKDNHNRPNEEFESLIHNRSADTVPVNATVFKLSKVNEMILNGNYFFSTFCIPEKLIYDAGRIPLESTLAKHDLPRLKVLNQIHAGMMEKAKGFLAGAVNFYESREFSLCGFMLHQVVEHGLNSLLQPLMQFRLQTHNLHKLMRISRRLSLEIFNFFPRDTDSEIRLFQLLQKAYIHARYKDTFELKEEDAAILLERIKLLLHKIAEEFDRIAHSVKVPANVIEA